jgi:hypothetical protein
MLVFVQWLADQREAQAFVPPPSLGEESMAVGWDPRSCWDCDSIAPVARLLFFGVLGILFWVGVRLDCRPANHWNMVLILVLAAAGYVGAAIYTSRSAIVALLFITLAAVFFWAVVQFGRLIARRCGAPARLSVILYGAAAVISIGVILYSSIASPICPAACLMVGSCLLTFGMYSTSRALRLYL